MPPTEAAPTPSGATGAELGDDFEVNQLGNRAVARTQADPRERLGADRPSVRWACSADVAKRRTGKATGWKFEVAGPFFGVDADSASAERLKFINEYLNPVCRTAASKRTLETSKGEHDDGEEQRPKRSAPINGMYKELQPRGGLPRAGPGRGHTNEAARPLPDVVADCNRGGSCPLPPVDALNANWLQQQAIKKQWQTASIELMEQRITILEQEVADKNLDVRQRDETIKRLRQRVRVLIALPPQGNVFIQC